MKVKIMLAFLLLLGTAFGTTAFSGSDPEPICIPGKPCQVEPKKFDSDPEPLCRPGVPCVEKKLFDVGTQPMCRPGIPCHVEPKNFDGGPFPVPLCQPCFPCPDNPLPFPFPCQLEPKKFDGGPDPICIPGRPCQNGEITAPYRSRPQKGGR
jgi:hypothetical protein